MEELKFTKNKGAIINQDEEAYLKARQRKKLLDEQKNTLEYLKNKILELEQRILVLENNK